MTLWTMLISGNYKQSMKVNRRSTTYIASMLVLFNHTHHYSISFATVDYDCSAKIIVVTSNYSKNRVGQ